MATKFDATMQSRVIAYQLANGLTPDGKAGQKTWMTFTADTAVQQVTEQEEVVADQAPDLSVLAEFPLLLDLLENGRTEEGMKDIYLRWAGVDIDELLQEIESMMGDTAQSQEVTE